MIIAGLDFGGTSVKIGFISADGTVMSKTEMAFDPKKSFEDLVDSVCESVMNLQTSGQAELTAVGISAPGYARPDSGVLIDGTHNVPVLKGQSLPAALGDRLGLPAFIDNDGTCAAIGELLFGAGRAFNNFVLITIGTGIGGGVIINRRVVTGRDGLPPEIGAICLDPDGPINYSGIPGTFERLASASGIVEIYKSESNRAAMGITPRKIFLLAAAGDPAAAATVDRVARYIAQAFGIMINLLNLEACIIGGGVSKAGYPLLEAVRRHLPAFTWPMLYRHSQVLLARLGNDTGMIGAATLAAQRLGLY
ncbi:MAG: ROK family protein [Desulfobacterales bacterium]|nr:MAG: ROK family protein [Desulfobacterales bacterium]